MSGSSGQASQEVYAGANLTPEANIVTITSLSACGTWVSGNGVQTAIDIWKQGLSK